MKNIVSFINFKLYYMCEFIFLIYFVSGNNPESFIVKCPVAPSKRKTIFFLLTHANCTR